MTTNAQTNYLYLINTHPCKGTFEEYGYADEKGKIVIPIGKYPMCYTDTIRTIGFVFSMDEEHDIIIGGKWGYIDKTGKEIFPAIFDKAYPFYEGEAKVQIGEDVFYITTVIENKKE